MTFGKAGRIRKSEEYRALSINGHRFYSDFFIIIYKKNRLPVSRLGITVSKKVGNAVNRNRIKRVLREFFRLNRDILPDRLDINVIARKSCGKQTRTAIRDNFENSLKSIAAEVCIRSE